MRSALKFDLFADQARQRKIEALEEIRCRSSPNTSTLTTWRRLLMAASPADTRKGGRPPYPTAVMVRILVLRYLNDLSV